MRVLRYTERMYNLCFEWDEIKNIQNKAKHAIDFQRGQEAFSDPFRLIFPDKKHSIEEERFFLLGLSQGRLILVCFTTRHHDTMRIISCRFANRFERRLYERKNKR